MSIAQGSSTITIGRDPASTICVDEPTVSWLHATLTPDDDERVLKDNNTTLGTFVNGLRCRKTRLQPGDIVQIGNAGFLFDGTDLTPASAAEGGIDLTADGLVIQAGSKRLLAEVTTTFGRNEFVALIGGSGAGKSTLLRALSGILPISAGSVQYNGSELADALEAFRPTIGYVPQSDIVHRLLTVERALDYAARLRLPDDWTAQDRATRIAEVLEQVDLAERASLQISKLSGGQLKRVSVALELLGNPRVLFLDEPTSGLDPGLDKRLMRLFRKLADDGRTVVVVTHSIENLDQCDRVVMLAPGGFLVYDGPPEGLPSTLEVESYADAFTAVEDEGEERAREQTERTRRTRRRRDAVARTPWPRRPADFTRQFGIIMRRSFELALRDRRNLAIVLAQAPIIGLILFAVGERYAFRDLAVPGPTTQSIVFALSIVAVWFGLINAIREITKERAIVDRERLAGLRVDAYVLAKSVPLFLLIAIQSLAILAITVLKTGLPARAVVIGGFGDAFVSLVLTGFCAVSIALLVSALVANEDRATSTIPFLLIPQFLLAGVTFQLGVWTKPLSYLTMSRWGTESIGGSVSICRHAAAHLVCDANLHYPLGPLGLVVRWVVMLVATLALLGATILVLHRQRARL